VEGDLVLTASGEELPIVWVGSRHVDCRNHPDPLKVWPVRVKAGAFGPQLPSRDLLPSPQHAIFDEAVLIPVKYLVNGASVVIEDVASIEYFHVELERHELLLAEGLPTESYLENGDRDNFENCRPAHPAASGFLVVDVGRPCCAEMKVAGPEVEAVRAKLTERSPVMAKPAVSRRSRRKLDHGRAAAAGPRQGLPRQPEARRTLSGVTPPAIAHG
jgi:hypothetical protein